MIQFIYYNKQIYLFDKYKLKNSLRKREKLSGKRTLPGGATGWSLWAADHPALRLIQGHGFGVSDVHASIFRSAFFANR